MIRLFVALALPEDVRRRLEMLRGGLPGARWQSAEQMHLTLRFIGEVDGAAFREIGDALAHIEAEPFSLTLEGVGRFPPRGRVRILWAGVVQNPALMRLRERTEAVITGLGFEPDGRNLCASRDPRPLRFAGGSAPASGVHLLSRPLHRRAVSGALVRAIFEPPRRGRRSLRGGGELSPSPGLVSCSRRSCTFLRGVPFPSWPGLSRPSTRPFPSDGLGRGGCPEQVRA